MNTHCMKLKKFLFVSLLAMAAFGVGFVVHPHDNYFEISKNMDIFGKLYREINSVYVDEVKPGQLMKVGIEAMLAELDPYTNFFSESQIEDFKVMSTGQYSGIGATIDKKGDRLLITEINQESAAIEAGLRIGDEVLGIDDQSTEDVAKQDLNDINNLLKGEQGSEVRLRILRPGESEPRVLTIPRKFIKKKNVPYYGMATETIGYIKLTGFTQDAGKEVAEATLELKQEHPELEGIILDLRGNPGGRLDESVNVTNVFISRGETVVETRGRMEGSTHQYAARNNPVDTEIPLTVLINDMSASASEIVSGTIQDLDRGVIIGRRSFGKGLVQNVRPLSYNTQLKVTIAKYYTPSGRCIQAIDYSHREEDGTLGRIPDSLKTAFKTRNGRTVYDGGGVEPDIEVSKPPYKAITQALLSQGLIFDFATQYANQHAEISTPDAFTVDDAIYQQFAAFVRKQNFQFEAAADVQLAQLRQAVEKSQYLDAVSEDLNTLSQKIERQKELDIQKYQGEIAALLQEEIIKRYYYQDGLIKASFKSDADLLAAINVIQNPQQYEDLLKP